MRAEPCRCISGAIGLPPHCCMASRCMPLSPKLYCYCTAVVLPQGIKVYWHVLEAMLRAEEGRARLPAACSLLTRWSFHQCLLACSFELVAASYRMGLLSFPAIPAKLALKPFDLSKMIGPFVKAEPTLPRWGWSLFAVCSCTLAFLWGAGDANSMHVRLCKVPSPNCHLSCGPTQVHENSIATTVVKSTATCIVQRAIAQHVHSNREYPVHEAAASTG